MLNLVSKIFVLYTIYIINARIDYQLIKNTVTFNTKCYHRSYREWFL